MKNFTEERTLSDELGTKPEVVTKVEELILPLLEAQGAELVDLEYARPRRGRAILRLFVDHPGGGITLEEITRISRIVSGLLDVHDLIPGSYNLEVSSPGLTRALKKPQDYQRFVGRLVRVTTRSPWEGHQVHSGILQGLKDNGVCLKEGDHVTCIPLSEIARARLEIDLKNTGKEG
ncbi:MAG: ribosome maturation factor RimP [Thermodesulfobacteriota bacterium]